MELLMGLLILVVGLLFLMSPFVAIYFFLEVRKANQKLEKYSSLSNLDNEEERMKGATTLLKEQGKKLQNAVADLKHQLADLEDQTALQEYGLYKPKYDFKTSVVYKVKLDEIRLKQKEMIKNSDVILWEIEWTVGESKSAGRTMMNQRTKMTLRAFNGECESLILKVKYSNVKQIEDRIVKLFHAINNLSKADKSSISPAYLDSKIQELHLVHEYQEKVHAEKEEQRQVREQMREEQRAQKELDRAQQEAEKEEQRYEKALNKAKLDLAKSTGDKQTKLQEEIDRLSQKLEEAHVDKERAISRAQMTKSGHVYIISNIGSFGDNIYKIGMTRRLEPLDRVKELGDASVPFLFDVHAMIYSDNAPEMENNLHKVFSDKRTNLVNYRKEYFNIKIDEVEKAVKQFAPEAEFILTAEAEDYRKTLVLRAESEKTPISVVDDVYNDLFA